MCRQNSLTVKFMMALAVLSSTATSCTEGPEEAEKGRLSGYGHVSFSINTGLSAAEQGRSPSIESLDWGRPEESYVEKVRVVLYGPDSRNGLSAQYVFDFNIRSREAGDMENPQWKGFVEDDGIPATEAGRHLYRSDDDHSFVTFSRKVPRGSYHIAAFINPPDDLLAATEPGENMSGIISEPFSLLSAFLTVRSWGVAADNYFFMSNLQGIFEITPEDLMTSDREANESPVNVLLTRAVAKVTVEDTAPTVPSGAKANAFSWQLDVTNKLSYWVRKPAPKLTAQGVAGEKEKYEKIEYGTGNTGPLLDYLKTTYSEDPNFNGLSHYGTNGGNVDESDRQDNFNYLKVAWASDTPIPNNAFGTYEYCLENTALPEDQYADVFTSVVVRCRYTPEAYFENESYFVYEGYVIDVQAMQDYVDDPQTIPQVLKDLGLAENIALAKADGEFRGSVSSLSQSFESHSVKFYNRGINYYRIPIGHAALPDEGMSVEPERFYGRYGVLRNNHYSIKVKSLKGPGSPVLATGDGGSLSSRTAADSENILYSIKIVKGERQTSNLFESLSEPPPVFEKDKLM